MIRLLSNEYVKPSDDLFRLAKLLLKENNVDQWQTDYPNHIDALDDINKHQAYGYFVDGQLVAYMAIVTSIDENYANIDGCWMTDDAYYCVHRLCVNPKFKHCGVGYKMMMYAIEYAKKHNVNIRVDTHQDNLTMQHLLKKLGFSYCGEITLEYDGSKRNAYELVLE